MNKAVLFKAWRLLSVATVLVSLFFFSLFFIYFILGYALVISEPSIFIASSELALSVSAAIYMVKSLHFKLSWSPCGWLFAGVSQYFDFLTTYIDSKSGKGQELNLFVNSAGGIYSWSNITVKLILLPALCLFLQFRMPNSKTKRISGTITFLFYMFVILDNIVPLVI